jgi:hypothetical protein
MKSLAEDMSDVTCYAKVYSTVDCFLVIAVLVAIKTPNHNDNAPTDAKDNALQKHHPYYIKILPTYTKNSSYITSFGPNRIHPFDLILLVKF